MSADMWASVIGSLPFGWYGFEAQSAESLRNSDDYHRVMMAEYAGELSPEHLAAIDAEHARRHAWDRRDWIRAPDLSRWAWDDAAGLWRGETSEAPIQTAESPAPWTPDAFRAILDRWQPARDATNAAHPHGAPTPPPGWRVMTTQVGVWLDPRGLLWVNDADGGWRPGLYDDEDIDLDGYAPAEVDAYHAAADALHATRRTIRVCEAQADAVEAALRSRLAARGVPCEAVQAYFYDAWRGQFKGMDPAGGPRPVVAAVGLFRTVLAVAIPTAAGWYVASHTASSPPLGTGPLSALRALHEALRDVGADVCSVAVLPGFRARVDDDGFFEYLGREEAP